MFPFVPSGSELQLCAAPGAQLCVGDIVVYPGARDAGLGLVAHRVIAIERGFTGATFHVRGDAQASVERLPEAALVYWVARVQHRGFAYETRSWFGRALARVAVQRGRAFALATRAAQLMAAVMPRQFAADGGEAQIALSSSSSSSTSTLAVPSDASSRDSLLRGLKHELRTPLNAILGFADLLLGELDGPLDADERENVGVVREAGWNLLALINEVLDLTTALVTPGEPVYEDVDVLVMLEEVKSELEERRAMRPVHVRVLAPDQLDVRLERRLLLRVLRTLGDVALEVTTAGEISFSAELRVEDSLELRIRADGFGVHGATGDVTTFALAGYDRGAARARRLLGMRLAIAQRLVENHPGALRVDESGGEPALLIALTLGQAPPSDDVAADASADVALALAYMAAMGHDLRTPLNAILGFADLLTMGTRAHKPWAESQRRSLEIVRERAVDLAALVDDMIDWAKLEAGELELSCVEQPILPLLERAMDAAIKRSGARGLKIELAAGSDLGTGRVDGARCVQAIVGLLDHAIRSNPGPCVTLRAQRAPARLQFEIIDPGLEIRAQDHTVVFDAFRPSHAPTGQRIAGLQLGTSVARSLLRAHGGDVWFESRPGRGTTFVATLPLL